MLLGVESTVRANSVTVSIFVHDAPAFSSRHSKALDSLPKVSAAGVEVDVDVEELVSSFVSSVVSELFIVSLSVCASVSVTNENSNNKVIRQTPVFFIET